MDEFIRRLVIVLYFMTLASTIVLWVERTTGRDISKAPDWLTWGMIAIVALALSLISKHL